MLGSNRPPAPLALQLPPPRRLLRLLLLVVLSQAVQGFLRPLPPRHHHHQRHRRYSSSSSSSSSPATTMTTATTAPAADTDANCRHLYGYGDPNHKPSILQTITKQRYADVAEAQSRVPASQLKADIAAFDAAHGKPLNLFERIRGEERPIALAAEFKRASPSKGDIATDLVAAEQGVKYTEAGAGILSVLTEPKWFKGSLEDMRDVRLATEALPSSQQQQQPRPAVLRKDFVVEEYQILEARAYGADTVLLIVAILEVDRLHRLIACARRWGMEPLVEVNTLAEMEIALDAGAKVIGVNNRNLHTFQLDLGTTERVMEAARRRGLSWDRRTGDILLAALSGISARADVERYERAGVAAVLIGETLMRAPDPAKAVRELIGLEDGGPVVGAKVLVKVCGVTRPEDALAATQAGAGLVGTIFCKSKRQVTGAQARAVVEAVRGFGERTQRVLPYQAAVPGAPALSPAWFEHWRQALLRVTRRTPLVVGVFQNNSAEEVAALVEESGVDLVQLHGEEPLAFAAEVSRRTGAPCLKVLHVPHEGAQVSEVLAGLTPDTAAAADAGENTGGPIAILLDTSVGGQKGGSGTQFDWTLAAAVQAQGYPVIVAGGLLPENVEAALQAARPFGVDVSGGVEASPGVKDHAKVADFVGKARAFKA